MNKAISLLLLLITFSLYAADSAEKKRYIVVVNSVKAKLAPSSKAKDANFYLALGSIIFSSKIIRNSSDYDFVETLDKRSHKKVYVPLEMLSEIPKASINAGTGETSFSSEGIVPFLYVPQDIVELNTSLTYGEENILIKEEVRAPLYRMLTDARKNGHNLYVARGFASLAERISEYEAAIAENPKQNSVPKPPYSKYGTGLYIDITDAKTGLDYKDYVKSPKAWEWLSKNCGTYGFTHADNYTSLLYTGEIRKTGSITKSAQTQIEKEISIGKICSVHIFKEKEFATASYIWVHHNEKSAGKTLEYALNTYGGHSIHVQNRDRRNLYIRYGKKYYAIDPNRIFTENGIELYIRKHYPRAGSSTRRGLKKRALRVRNAIITNFEWSHEKYLLALHSSQSGSKFSIEEYNKKNAYLTYTNPKQNPKNLFYTTSLKDYYFFKTKNYNVVYQRTTEDDGSLSVYAAQKNLPYINIEVEEGNDEDQKKMLDLAIECISQNYKKRSL